MLAQQCQCMPTVDNDEWYAHVIKCSIYSMQ